jgi:hypothetical protein
MNAPKPAQINLSVRGLGIVLYSPWAVRDIPASSDFLTTHLWKPEDVAQYVNASIISCVGTGSPGDYIVNIAPELLDGGLPEDAAFPTRLGLEVRDETVCVRDLYDFLSWKPDCPTAQKVRMANGFYRITAYTKEPASGVLGDSQEIYFHFERTSERAALAHVGVPQLC